MSVSSGAHSTLPMVASRSPASLRWRAETLALPTATLMPRPMAAGVFGMARTIAVPGASDCSRNRSVLPAMIESTSVVLPR